MKSYPIKGGLLNSRLQAFMAVAKYKTVHIAADAIHITQAAVTQRIRTLEAHLGSTLFIRTHRGMQLTSEGEALLQYCHIVRDLEGEILAKIKGAAIDSEISLCITGPGTVMRPRVIPQCLPVMERFPNLLMNFNIGEMEVGAKMLRVGECQFAIIKQEDVMAEMESKILKPERYVLVCSPSWKNRDLHDIIQNERIIDFQPTNQMTFNYLKHYNLFDLARYDRHYVNRIEPLAMLFMEGVGYGVLTTEFAKPYIEQGKLIALNAHKVYEHKIALAWYNRPQPPPYFSELIQAIN